MKILLAVDGSKHALHAARWLAKNSALFAAPLEIVLFNADAGLMKPVERKLGRRETERYYEGNAEYAFKSARKVLAGAGLSFAERFVVGDAAKAIAGAAKREHCDLVLMGTRGQGALRQALLGSVASKVIGQSGVPVLVVR
jgi:nucleotide-binding universal stress UspA family protein